MGDYKKEDINTIAVNEDDAKFLVFATNAGMSGSGQLNCSDGTTAIFQFKRLSLRRGYGAGSTSRGARVC